MTKALVIIPSFNEAENISELLDKLFAVSSSCPGFEISALVVDGNSPDGTIEIVNNLANKNPEIHLIVESKKEGLGRAYAKGFEWGLERDFDLLVEMDADLSHDPKYLPEMFKLSETFDLVIGSRYVVGGGTSDWGIFRRLISWGASFYTRLITGLLVKDVTGGFKCFKREVLEKVRFDDVKAFGYGFQIEMNYRVWKAGFKITEFPIIFPDRQKGVSKFNNSIFWEAFFLVWKLRLGLN